ncbi:hypothetical protein DMH04_50995 [Kibdelosporangium aridum]|uniref:Uncharacterized protein n=1 Tax=Kibdelosporangium aridum TaxID=2030 RepID=A0A428YAY7_KIBAR|nr:hypothetical protein DMH04_50995 [Kibdelosporangium aridum]
MAGGGTALAVQLDAAGPSDGCLDPDVRLGVEFLDDVAVDPRVEVLGEVGCAFAVAGTAANVTAAAMLRDRFSTRASCRARSGTPAG